MLRAVTFDFWNTLFVDFRGRERQERRSEILATALEHADMARPRPVIDEALRDGYGFFDQVWYHEQRTPSCAEILDSILASLNARLPRGAHERVVEVFETMVLDLRPDLAPGAHEAVTALAEQYRLGIICDTAYSPGSVLRALLDDHGILEPFDYLYFSNEHGVSKPDRRVFEQTLGELHAIARDAAHVGDIQRTDIAGAQAAGMSAVHYPGANRHDATRSTADALIDHFEELPTALKRLPRRRLRR